MNVLYSMYISDMERSLYDASVLARRTLYKIDKFDKIILLTRSLLDSSSDIVFNDVYYTSVPYFLWYILPSRELWLSTHRPVPGSSSIYEIFANLVSMKMFHYATLDIDNIKSLIENVVYGGESDCQPLKTIAGSGRFCMEAYDVNSYTENITPYSIKIARAVMNNSTIRPREEIDIYFKLVGMDNDIKKSPVLVVAVIKL